MSTTILDELAWRGLVAQSTDIGALGAAHFDGVTAALQVNADVHAPLLCVTDVFDVASGDLSLPGEVGQ